MQEGNSCTPLSIWLVQGIVRLGTVCVQIGRSPGRWVCGKRELKECEGVAYQQADRECSPGRDSTHFAADGVGFTETSC